MIVVYSITICNMCKSLVQNIKTNLNDGDSEILKKADKECDTVTNNNIILDPMCKTLVNREVNYIISELRNNKTPDQICQDLQFCPSIKLLN
ncbi:Saposin-like type B, 1 domain and Saposin-like type B, 2 domain and Saposin B domain and Saposin-like domain-containing protein [Strongyloides ratti]|uniref:Saposin-like type B, 1 domain and Saposin-like type B, 2 domain and Saposin B domain and Saposin-like domain-containing protein n=1 Tax=Strongyloides ratti TaxID=34506 RepID=A0A090LB88_STRRB|nr:Saposin-like type B, 1 domain and Saposin-like type B, 2 domain and Saposin B domain and Saposin-like domain-containing protein [Strongyloides ratti]CEF64760.1 Saposin-like type B, 1 domain and Saposin-like type B, 2 domain and Saposin B domain and Saposin-like domain-containing protein [Strongyloides ratti]